jgi:hypothetical protein
VRPTSIRSAMRSGSLFALALVATTLIAQDPPTASSPFTASSAFKITGIVVSTTTGAPILHCHILPAKIERGPNAVRRIASQLDGADTDEHGHFTLSLPFAGSWSLRATARGYRTQFLDQHGSFSTSVVLTDQSPTLDVQFRIAPDSAITGVVLDEANEPIRQAQVLVYPAPRSGEGGQGSTGRAFGSTDDRGRYEIAALAPGDYRVSVQARPWYAVPVQPFNTARTQVSGLEPSLDVTYPLTWFPGGGNADAAQIVTLHDGETREADMQLLPIPSVHLRLQIPTADPSTLDGARRNSSPPQVTSLSGNNVGISTSLNGQGQFDVGGLAPGLYRVKTMEPGGQPGRSTIVEVTANSARNLDLATAAITATINFKIDGDPEAQSAPITFVDATNDRNAFRSAGTRPADSAPQRRPQFQPSGTQQPDSRQNPPRTQQRASSPAASASSDPLTRTIDLPPGRYLVYQGGSNNFFLSGMTLGTKEIPGRMVTIPSGESSLTIRITTGRTTVAGVCMFSGRPVAGAMVLLVPITLGQAGAIAEIRRDQTNSDGSYDLDNVIPGQYILIALDHGWNTNWSDPSTLSRYLGNGIPLDLHGSTTLNQQIMAQTP